MKIVAITSCATGIAHSYMAAESLEKTALNLGHQIKVEVQGAMGIENELTQSEVDNADIVIFAIDVGISNTDRFADKQVIKVGPHEAITDPKKVIEDAINSTK